MKIDEDITVASRRKFLRKLAYGSVLALGGCRVETAAVRDVGRHGFIQQIQVPYPHSTGYKTLSFEHMHTGEKLKLTYFEHGNYIKDAS